MAIARLGPKNQITIPAEIVKKLRLKQGDFLEVQATGDELRLVPQKLIPRDQAWYWTKEWQDMEREADEDIAAGRVSPVFENAKEAIEYLHRFRK
ncbi:MAG TPA: AbrB/MazE/SpoVT family DNA-binding domain-containing protein [Dehalococcoidia bacterium]|jgi:AbrB family looped-hinge helix DNA binding protein